MYDAVLHIVLDNQQVNVYNLCEKADENLEEAEWEEVTNNSLMLALDGLDDRSQDILRSRWLSDEKATLHDLAGKYGVSAERIRQLEKNAMNKIKACMEA